MGNTLKKVLLFVLIGCFVAGSLTLILWQSLRTAKLTIWYAPAEDGLALKKYSGTSGDKALVIPDTAEDGEGNRKPVTALGEFSISNASYLEELYIGANVKTIHPWAITNCEELRCVTVDPDNPYFTSVDGVLYSRDMMRLILFPNSNKQNGCFKIPDSVAVIGENAFYKCRKLLDVEFPPGVRMLEEKAFFRCSGLRALELPEGLEIIGADAFAFCDGLEGGVYIPASCREIRAYAFSGNDSKISKFTILAGEGEIALAKDWLPKREKKASAKVDFEFAQK